MAVIESGRMTHDHDGELVVFLIGMRINRWWRPDLWLPVFNAMPPMLAELSKDPESGMLGYRLTLGEGGPLLIMYWDSHELLYAYASRPDARAPSGLDPLQPAGPQGTGGGGHLARDLPGRRGRVHLRRDARQRAGQGDGRRSRSVVAANGRRSAIRRAGPAWRPDPVPGHR